MSDPGFRVGTGYDVHRLVPERRLVLGGVTIPSERGLLGHSDADVVIHAAIDALLGAAALGDIGVHFPPSDPAYRDSDSRDLLARARDLLARQGWRPVNLDCTVVAEQPSLAPHTRAMREALGEVLGIAPEQVSVKATTNEGLGFLGRAEGIAAIAVALIARERGP